MAELRIQPKKSAPSPWLLVALAALVLAVAAYFYLRPDPADEAAPAATAAVPPAPIDSLAPSSPAAVVPASPDSVATSSTALVASPTRSQLLQLAPALTKLADRADLRDDASIREQRDNFTSATSRLESGDPAASLRPGLVAAASLLLAVQQKGYPNLETEATTLLGRANQLSGRDATPAEQTQNREYLAQVANLLNTVSYPAKDVL